MNMLLIQLAISCCLRRLHCSVAHISASLCREVTKDFSLSVCGRDVVKTAMTQLLLYYTRALELLKRAGPEGLALVRDAVTVPSILYEIKRRSRD